MKNSFQFCNWCRGKSSELIGRCKQCKSVAYCSFSCQQLDWKDSHESICNKDKIAYSENDEIGFTHVNTGYNFYIYPPNTYNNNNNDNNDNDNINKQNLVIAETNQESLKSGDNDNDKRNNNMKGLDKKSKSWYLLLNQLMKERKVDFKQWGASCDIIKLVKNQKILRYGDIKKGTKKGTEEAGESFGISILGALWGVMIKKKFGSIKDKSEDIREKTYDDPIIDKFSKLKSKEDIFVKLSFERISKNAFIKGKPIMKNFPKEKKKIFTFFYDELPNSNIIEISIYTKIVNQLIVNNYTPHLPVFITLLFCRNFINKVEENEKKFIRNIKENEKKNIKNIEEKEREKRNIENYKILKEEIIGLKGRTTLTIFRGLSPVGNITKPKISFLNFNLLYGLIIEKIQGKTLNKLTESEILTFDKERWLSIIFQILYTLECFNKIGLRHNDTHLGNIFITEEKETKEFLYYE